MDIFNESAEEFLYKYINNTSPTGFEYPGQEIWLDYLEPFIDEHHLDNYGTAYGIVNPGQDYKVVIEAHADEISWFVNHISKDGYIRVIRNGGSDHAIAASKRVNIHTENGAVEGIFGWPAIHTRKGKNSKLSPKLSNIFIDVGAEDSEEVEEMGIHVGCVVTFAEDLSRMNDRFYVGRALDNRMGGFCITQVARMLKEKGKDLPFSLYIVNAVQEEIGLKGAQMIAHAIDPDVAIVTDVTHDTGTPLVKTKKYGDVKCGKGPSITYAPAVHNKLREFIIETAEEQNIDFQREAASRSTGTDTDAFAYSKNGVPSSLISLPLRYMHTTVETAHEDDIEAVIKLIYHTILRMESGQKFSYLR